MRIEVDRVFPHANDVPTIVLSLLCILVIVQVARGGYFKAMSRWFRSGTYRFHGPLLLVLAALFALSFLADGSRELLLSRGVPALEFLRQLGNLYGSAEFAFSIFVGAYFLAVLFRKGRLAFWILGLFAATMVAGIATDLLKYLFARTRPFAEVAQYWGWFRYEALVESGFGWQFRSFPSGHACTGWVIGLYALLTRRVKTGLVLLAFGVVTAYGRVATGSHWPSDTLGSALWAAVAALPFALHYLRASGELAAEPQGPSGRGGNPHVA
ncbi:MAG: phosphatase PAP2 family protein [Synergistales bacterium]|nr:phosphatase PAP2 family protein [Synergistales bacterium]